jgi:hypothetical protein
MDDLLNNISSADVADVRRHIQQGFAYCRNLMHRRDVGESLSTTTPSLQTVARRLGMPATVGASDTAVCRWLSRRYRHLSDDIRWIEERTRTDPNALSDGRGGRPTSVVPQRSLLRLMYLIGVVFAVVVSGAMCSAEIDTSGRAGDVCPLRLRSLGRDPIAPFRAQGFFASVAQTPTLDEVDDLARDPEVLGRVRAAVFRGASPSRGSDGVAAVYTIGPSSGAHPPPNDRAGHVYISMDRIAGLIPGYDALAHLGRVDGIPVSESDVIGHYRRSAVGMVDTMVDECLRRGHSFVFNATEYTIERLTRHLRSLRRPTHNVRIRVVVHATDTPTQWRSALEALRSENRIHGFGRMVFASQYNTIKKNTIRRRNYRRRGSTMAVDGGTDGRDCTGGEPPGTHRVCLPGEASPRGRGPWIGETLPESESRQKGRARGGRFPGEQSHPDCGPRRVPPADLRHHRLVF